MKCCLLPFPGTNVFLAHENDERVPGNNKHFFAFNFINSANLDADQSFVTCIKNLLPTILGTGSLFIKKLLDTELTGRDVISVLKVLYSLYYNVLLDHNNSLRSIILISFN